MMSQFFLNVQGQPIHTFFRQKNPSPVKQHYFNIFQTDAEKPGPECLAHTVDIAIQRLKIREVMP